jgi:hypothetical protein
MQNDLGFATIFEASESSMISEEGTNCSNTHKPPSGIENHALIFLNGLNKPCNSDLFDELVQVLAHKYDRDTLSITFPTFVKDLQNCHPELQMISSNRLQKIKLIYSHNIVTKSLATIFVHTSIKAHYKFENEGDPEI